MWKDPRFDVNWYDAKVAGIPRGSYWFYDSRVTPQAQAKLWTDTLKSDLGELPLFADYEESYGGSYKGGANFKIFLEEVKSLVPNKEIILYTAYWYWKDNVSSSLHDYYKQYGLWIANYGVQKPLIPVPFTDWLFWQYSEDGVGSTYGCSGGLDLNFFNGTQEEFEKRFNISGVEFIPPTPSEDKVISTRKYYDGAVYTESETYLPQGKTKYHVIELDTTKCEFFVSPQLQSRMYVPRFLEPYGLDIAINGDGFVSTTIAGFASSETRAYGKRGVEETLYISKENKISRDIQTLLWNAISYPNRLVVDGKVTTINKAKDDIRGRSAIGYNKDQTKFFMFVCDGKDYYSKDGMNFWEVAERMVLLGCDYAIMLDGGGSTTLAIQDNGKPTVLGVPCGEDIVAGFEHPMRRVANVLGVRMKTDGIISEPKPEEPPVVVVPPVEGDKMFKVVESVKSRLTPSMYQVNSKNILAGTTFDSDVKQGVSERIPIGGTMMTITWVQMPDKYWIPMIYNGVEYVKEVTVAIPPVVVPPVILTDDPYVSAVFTRASGATEKWIPEK
jgi:hypothetical protein